MNIETWLWVGTIGMLLGMVLLYLPLLSNKSEHEEGDMIAHFYVPMIAFTLYLLMALGAGALTTSTGRVFYFGRYIDWTFTTPLLLYSLGVDRAAWHGYQAARPVVWSTGCRRLHDLHGLHCRFDR